MSTTNGSGLEMNMKFKNSVTGQAKLEKYAKTLYVVKNLLETTPAGTNISSVASSANTASSKVKETNKATKELSKTTSSVGNVISKAFSVTSIINFAKGLKNIVLAMEQFTTASSEYIESLNLMDVAYQGATEEGRKLVNTLSEMYGLDESSLTESVALFKQLSNSMGLADEYGTTLSKTMTQLAIDISSLYNTSFERATSVLESSLAGQTKPIRGLTGADITASTLQVTLDNYGINESVSNLSYLEKRLVIVISLIEQLDEAQNDYGRTVESVSNQQKIFQEQTSRLARAIGNVFIPILSKVLPYLNGIVMALVEITNFIASLLGFSEEDYDYFGETDTVIDDLTDSLDDATSSSDSLKKSLRGFDELNNITSSSSSSSGSGSGIDADILEAFNKATSEYEDALENVQMKATRIRNTIMEWLGFTIEVDEATEDISFSFDHITAGTVIVGSLLSTAILKTLISSLKTIKSVGSILFSSSKITKVLTKIGEVTAGIALFVDGIKNLKNALSDIDSTALSRLMSCLEIIGGGALAGAAIGGLPGALIGAGVGSIVAINTAIVDVIETLMGLNTQVDSFTTTTIEALKSVSESIELTTGTVGDFRNSIDELNTTAEETLKTSEGTYSRAEDLIDSLKDYINVNGKVTSSHVKVKSTLSTINSLLGTNYTLTGNNIYNNGQLVTSYSELCDSVDEYCNKLRIQATIEAYKDSYNEKIVYQNELQTKQKKLIEELTEQTEGLDLTNEKTYNDWYEANKDTIEELDEIDQLIEGNSQQLSAYEKAVYYSSEGEYEKAASSFASFNEITMGTYKSSVNEIKNSAGGLATDVNQQLDKIYGSKTVVLKADMTGFTRTFERTLDGLSYTTTMTTDAYGNVTIKNVRKNEDGGIFKNGKWQDITAYATGGLPPVGQLFVANERGPELVGNIGSNTAVMNNDQIVASVSAGVYQAVRSAVGSSNSSDSVINIYLDKNHKLATYTLKELQNMASADGNPIEIGG